MFIFLDDVRFPGDVKWINYEEDVLSMDRYIPRTYNDFKLLIHLLHDDDILRDCIFSFDHDIQCFGRQGKEYTGQSCLLFLIEWCVETNIPLPKCYFHSMNPVGRKNMQEIYDVWKLRLEE